MVKLLFLLNLFFMTSAHAGDCHGRFLNPISDICWKCIFPLKIGGLTVASGGPEPAGASGFLCKCPRAPLPKIGVPISFWEPVRLVDVTRTPYCLINLGGIKIANTGVKDRGHVNDDQNNGHKRSYYNVHWYVYPILYILEVLVDFVCMEKLSLDIAFLSELDPFWNLDEKNAIFHPEAILFGNPIAQAACAADCAAASVHLPIDKLFWCSGCQGSLYPFGGSVGDHTGGVQASLLVMSRLMAKLHRAGVLWGYSGKDALCGRYFCPIMKRSGYRTQMTYPIPQTSKCQPIGATEQTWQAGREYPFKGEDFGYLVWRKRDCCLGP